MMKTEEPELCFPQLLNFSCSKTWYPPSVSIIIYIILSSICVVTVTLNLLVIISISHFKQLHTPTNLLLLSLAVSDFFVGIIVVFQIHLIDGCWYLGDHMCLLYCVLDYVITSASIGTMILISVDRYIAICYPLHYSTKITAKRVQICISLCWIFVFLYALIMLKDNLEQPGRYNSCAGECVVFVGNAAGIVDIFVSFVTPVSIMIVLYVQVFVVAVSQARAMRSQVAAVTLQTSVRVTVKKSELKAARTLGVVIVVFLICLCPVFCVALQESVLSVSTIVFFICLFYLNSCLNPLIYALFYPWFRKSLKFIVTLQILKPGSCEANML
ncbi:trace amine-associated receptor 13c-like [Xenentodon cancila]